MFLNAITILPLVAVLVLARKRGLVLILLCFALGYLCLAPVGLTYNPPEHHVGISEVIPVARTFTVVFVVGVFVAALSRNRAKPEISHLLLVGWLMLGTLVFWGTDSMVIAGVLHLLVGLSAWYVGKTIANAKEPTIPRAVACIVLVIVAVQVIVTLMQVAGLAVNPMDDSEVGILGGRVNGTSNHPGNLGKMLFLLLGMTLPLTASRDRRTLLYATAAVGLSFIPLALSQGRANFAAAGVAVLLWMLIGPVSVRVRTIFFSSGVLATILASKFFYERFKEDPRGGVRSTILEIAADALPNYISRGSGPNTYVDRVSQIYGSYIPVHNTLALGVIEIGAVGLVLLLYPVIRDVARGLRFWRVSPHYAALLCLFPGLALVAWTGWGMLGSSILPLWFFVYGFCSRTAQIETQVANSSGAEREGAQIDSSSSSYPGTKSAAATANATPTYPAKTIR